MKRSIMLFATIALAVIEIGSLGTLYAREAEQRGVTHKQHAARQRRRIPSVLEQPASSRQAERSTSFFGLGGCPRGYSAAGERCYPDLPLTAQQRALGGHSGGLFGLGGCPPGYTAAGDRCYPDLPVTPEERAAGGHSGGLFGLGGCPPGYTAAGDRCYPTRPSDNNRIGILGPDD